MKHRSLWPPNQPWVYTQTGPIGRIALTILAWIRTKQRR